MNLFSGKYNTEPNRDMRMNQSDSDEGTSVRNSHFQHRPINGSPVRTDAPLVIDSRSHAKSEIPKWKRYAGVAILTFIKLLIYIDRYTVAGVLIGIRHNFEITNAQAGLLQTVYVISDMLAAPMFGYLGDRWNRIWIIAGAIIISSGLTLLSSFIQSPDYFRLFLLTRALVSVGDACCATIAPTWIADMFYGPIRTKMLTVFYFAIPVGSGLGFIIGAGIAKALGGWEWAFRVTPMFGLISVSLLILVCPNPVRGASEKTGASVGIRHSYCNDLRYLTKNRSFIWVTLGYTFSAFVIGSLSLWGPTYIANSQFAMNALPACQGDVCDNANINFIFGVVICVAGFSGVIIMAELVRRWRLSGKLNADALVCAISSMVASPLLFIAIESVKSQLIVAWLSIFFSELLLCGTLTMISDMTLYVTQPNRRSTANGVQLLIGHLFGDAGSPYIIGVISDALASSMPDTYRTKYTSMKRSMYITIFVCLIGAVSYFIASFYIIKDKKKVDDFLKNLESTKDDADSKSLKDGSANSQRC